MRTHVHREHLNVAAIQWREQPAEVGPKPITALYRGESVSDVLRIAAALEQRREALPLLIIGQTMREQVFAHLRGSESELGGLLIGDAFTHATAAGASETVAVVRVLEALPGDDYASTAISLQLGTSVWTKARERLRDGRLVVGWYHSHPHLGAFFSGTDRRTQRAFFAHAYSVGWVIDPFATDAASIERCYLGPDALELDRTTISSASIGL